MERARYLCRSEYHHDKCIGDVHQYKDAPFAGRGLRSRAGCRRPVVAGILAMDGRKQLHLRGHATPLYFHVPAEVRSFTLTMRSGVPGETAVAKLFDPQNRAVATFRTVEQPEDKQTIDCRDNSGGHWKLVVNKADKGVLDDVWVEFGPELTGYCSLEPDKLLVVFPSEARPAR